VPLALHVFTDAIEDDDRIVHGIAGNGQNRRDDVQRQIVAEPRQEGEGPGSAGFSPRRLYNFWFTLPSC
jgi:hypothetical protein